MNHMTKLVEPIGIVIRSVREISSHEYIATSLKVNK